MGKNILIPAENVWDYYNSHMSELKTHMYELAENPEYGVVIYITDDGGLPTVIVNADENEVYSEAAVSQRDLMTTVKKIYDDYLTEKAIGLLTEPEDGPTMFDLEDEIEERETEIDDALEMFLDVVLDSSSAACMLLPGREDFDAIKEHFLEYLAIDQGLPVRRPMFLTDDDGADFFEEFPYEHMIFDDEPVNTN